MEKLKKATDKKYRNVAVAIVKDNDGRLLVVKRRQVRKSIDGSHLAWSFPGDGYDPKEDPQKTVEQFILEETGYKIKTNNKISERIYHPFGFHLYYYDAKLKSPEPVKKPKIKKLDGVAWVQSSDLKKYLNTNIDDGLKKFLGL